MKRIAKWILAALLLGGTAVILYFSLGSGAPRITAKPVPSPNGYDAFVQAIKVINTYTDSYQFERMNTDQLRALALANTECLRVTRLGFTQACSVPISYSSDTNYWNQHLSDLSGFKRIGLTMKAEGRLAEREFRTNDAAKSYMELARFGERCTHGGVLIDRLTGIAVEAHGLTALAPLVNSLDAPTCRDSIKVLIAIENDCDSIEQVLANEAEWVRHTFSWFDRARNQYGELLSGAAKAWRKNFIDKTHAHQRTRRDLILSLAARAYQLDHGRPPENAAQLVPDYLKAIPTDPASESQRPLPLPVAR